MSLERTRTSAQGPRGHRSSEGTWSGPVTVLETQEVLVWDT